MKIWWYANDTHKLSPKPSPKNIPKKSRGSKKINKYAIMKIDRSDYR